MRGFIAGGLALALLQAFVSSSTASDNVGTLFTIANSIASRVIDPTVALIPDLRK